MSESTSSLPRDADSLRDAHAAGERNFTGIRLDGAQLGSASLTESNFERALMRDADLCGATLIETSFVGATLNRTLFRDAKLWAADMERASVHGCDFSAAAMVGVVLKSADLREAKLVAANLSGANLTKANLSKASLLSADLNGANLLGADLTSTLIMEADLVDAKLWDAHLVDTDLRNSSLADASMVGARLDGVDFTGANLRGLDLSNATLSNVRVVASPTVLKSALGCRIDYDTYVRSKWTPDDLAAWVDAGAELIERERFPADALASSQGAGLTIFVDGAVTGFDRFAVEAVLFSVLGRASLCQAVESVVFTDGGFIRVAKAHPAALEAVAEGLANRVWRSEVPHLEGLLRLPDIFERLEQLSKRITRMELRGREVIDQNSQTSPGFDVDRAPAETAPRRRPLQTLRTWSVN